MRGHVQAGCLAVCGVISVACGQGRQTDAHAPAFVVSPGSISLSPGSWVQFTASIAVIWSIREGDAGGTIDSSGGYTALLIAGAVPNFALAKEFRAAIAAQPNYPLARFHLGRILVNQQKYDEAIQQLQRSLTPEDEQTTA